MLKNLFKTFLSVLVCIFLIAAGFFALSFIGSNQPQSENAKIITSNFIGYDLARAVTGGEDAVRMLIPPGSEMHNFEPTPQDIIDITNSDLFIYNGGESDDWVDKLLADSSIPREKTLRLMDYVNLKEEEISEGMEGEEGESEGIEYDEHIWTSPVNAQKLLNAISEKLKALHPENAETYQQNTENYAAKISALDQKFRNLVASNAHNKPLIFGDRFPFRYFVDEYGLDYYAAFPGCSDQTEASSATVAFLIETAKSEDVKTILKIELTSDQLAQTIAEAVGAEVLELSAAHNISKSDFDAGKTYVDILKNNLQTLEVALN